MKTRFIHLKLLFVSLISFLLYADIVTAESQFNCAMVDTQLNVEIPCINYQNQAYRLGLNYLSNNQNAENLCWSLGDISSTSDKGSCSTANNQLELNLPCVKLDGVAFNVQFQYSASGENSPLCQFILTNAEMTAVSRIETTFHAGCSVDYPDSESLKFYCVPLAGDAYKIMLEDHANKRVGEIYFAKDGELEKFSDYQCGDLYQNCPRFFSSLRTTEPGTYVYEWIDSQGDYYQYNVDTKLKVDGTGYSASLRRSGYTISGSRISADKSKVYEYAYIGYKNDDPMHWLYTDDSSRLDDRFFITPEITSCTLVELNLFIDDEERICRNRVIEKTQNFMKTYSGQISVPNWYE